MLPQEAITLRESSAPPSSARVQRRAQQQGILKSTLWKEGVQEGEASEAWTKGIQALR